MANYTYEYGSHYPQRIMDLTHFQNLTNSQYAIAEQYNTLLQNGNISAANTLLESNPWLSKKVIDAVYINKIEEEIRNAQIYGIQQQQIIYTQSTEPENKYDNDVWIGGEE